MMRMMRMMDSLRFRKRYHSFNRVMIFVIDVIVVEILDKEKILVITVMQVMLVVIFVL